MLTSKFQFQGESRDAKDGTINKKQDPIKNSIKQGEKLKATNTELNNKISQSFYDNK